MVGVCFYILTGLYRNTGGAPGIRLKGNLDKIKAHAQKEGMSLNAYIVGLIEKDMGPLEEAEEKTE